MSFVQATFNNAALWAFITGFGEGVNDLRCQVADMRLKGSVDTTTHYFTKSINVLMEEYKAGVVNIPDVHKVGAFLKSCKEDDTTLRYVGNTLTLKNGNDEFSTPSHDHIMSYTTVGRAEQAISAAKKNSWKKLGRADLECHGNFSTEDIQGLSSMTKVVGKDAPVKVRLADNEMTITAGNQRGAKMSRQINVDVNAQEQECETVFGSHFPKLLNLMSSGTILFHMGNKSALVLDHSEIEQTLILKHQEGADK